MRSWSLRPPYERFGAGVPSWTVAKDLAGCCCVATLQAGRAATRANGVAVVLDSIVIFFYLCVLCGGCGCSAEQICEGQWPAGRALSSSSIEGAKCQRRVELPNDRGFHELEALCLEIGISRLMIGC